ncbi:protein SOGA3-like [Microtus oregoni]|uniref:protein SOGA3-like n=1 Tax=Microtus oregoni TaxID=111838 RepID=UPI001BB0EE5C|nr:protein SOGA3-like [Microtus oregoni]
MGHLSPGRVGAAGGTAAAGSGTGEPRSRTACLGLGSTRSGAGEAVPPPGWCLRGDPEPNEPGSGAEGRRRTPRLPAPGGSGSRAVTCGGGGGGGGAVVAAAAVAAGRALPSGRDAMKLSSSSSCSCCHNSSGVGNHSPRGTPWVLQATACSPLASAFPISGIISTCHKCVPPGPDKTQIKAQSEGNPGPGSDSLERHVKMLDTEKSSALKADSILTFANK